MTLCFLILRGRGGPGGGRPGAGPTPVGFPATNYLDSVCFITDKSIDPARWPLPLRIFLYILGCPNLCDGQKRLWTVALLTVTGTFTRWEDPDCQRSPVRGSEGVCGRLVEGVVDRVSLVNPFIPKHKFSWRRLKQMRSVKHRSKESSARTFQSKSTVGIYRSYDFE